MKNKYVIRYTNRLTGVRSRAYFTTHKAAVRFAWFRDLPKSQIKRL